MLQWGICSQLPSEFLYFTLHQMLALVINIQHTRTLSVSRTCHACHKAKNRLANYLPDRISHVSAYEDLFGYSFITSKWLACVGYAMRVFGKLFSLCSLVSVSLCSLSLSLCANCMMIDVTRQQYEEMNFCLWLACEMMLNSFERLQTRAQFVAASAAGHVFVVD